MYHSRNNSEKKVLGLNDEEIQEEILNADLKALGISDDDINAMAIQEKQNVLTALKQSTSSHPLQDSVQLDKQVSLNNAELTCNKNKSNTTIEKNEIEISLDSPEEYPSLPSPSNNPSNIKKMNYLRQQLQLSKLKQQPKQIEPNVNIITINNATQEEAKEDESGDEYLSDSEQSFSIPGFVDDNGTDLNDRARKKPMFRPVRYYTLTGQNPKEAVKTMLRRYNSWYKIWCSVEKCNSEPNDINIVNLPDVSFSQENNYVGKSSEETVFSNIESPVKNSSPDIEEIEVTEVVHSPESKLSQSAKAKPLPHETRQQDPQTSSNNSAPAIALNFGEKWNAETGWNSSTSNKYNTTLGTSYSTPGTSPSSCNNSLKKRNNDKAGLEVQRRKRVQDFQPDPKNEPKVQCPICQQDFVQSKVENHAAACEGFPAETRSRIPPSQTFVSKAEESNSQDEINCSEEFAEDNTNVKLTNKKRATDSEDHNTTKRVCVNRL